MRDIVSIVREDSCPCCKNKRCIDLYNSKGSPMRYTLILDQRDLGKIDHIPDNEYVMYMMCSRCRMKFIIDWQQSPIWPKPLLYPHFYKEFMLSYGGMRK